MIAFRTSGLRLATGTVAICSILLCSPPPADAQDAVPVHATSDWAEIRVTDEASGRGIPLVELETVNAARFVTDNAGRVAFSEPTLMGREIYFFVRSHGYDVPKDGFGYAGFRVTPQPGKVCEMRLARRNLAERLCRLTGEGLYRDSRLLGYQPPHADAPHPGRVAGQDSIQAAVYRGQVRWFWGDTQRMEYPLGLFRTAGATTKLADLADPKFDLSDGLPYDYFVDEKTGFARAMMPLPERPEGVIWIDGVCTVPDSKGIERLIAHYSRRKGLVEQLEHGVAIFNDDRNIFEPASQLELSETWRHPAGHSIAHEEAGKKWLYFGNPSPNVRVPADLESVLDSGRYEAFSCAKAGTNVKQPPPDFADDGTLAWRWQTSLPPTDSKVEQAWVKSGALQPVEARFLPADAADADQRILLHNGTVRWNAYRQRWVMIAGQLGGKSSLLGEVWYAEAKAITGPYNRAVKIVTHDRQTFYNVCHHPFLDQTGGRMIHFEGTYTNDFSGNPDKTPRYNYNQVLYRLDLDDPALQAARVE